MNKLFLLFRGALVLVAVTAAVTIAGSVSLAFAVDAIFHTELISENVTSYAIWAGVSYLALGVFAVRAYGEHFRARLTHDPDLVSIEDLFRD